jgi:lipopolysaccharide transport system ATP-binding protein
VIGIIGPNGAGKSTLLKILSRITEPTEGLAEIHGKVGSLLEVGTGFHPELTGRENIYLNGAILGMRKTAIERNFDAIVGFAEIERFLDTPVKHYSSGMYTRLAFAVAAHLEPEILLVDEVLAVGDAAFQKRCLGKMEDIASQGRTVILVSHNMTAVQSLCSDTMLLRDGRVADRGPSRDVVSRYLAAYSSIRSEQVWQDPATAPGNDRVRLHRLAVRPTAGSPSDAIATVTPVDVECDFWNLTPDTPLSLSLHIYDHTGALAFATAPIFDAVWFGRPLPVGLFRSVCHIPGNLLNDGIYRVQLFVVQNQTTILYSHDDALVFEVQDDIEGRQGAWHGKWPGALRPRIAWTTRLVDEWSPPPPAASRTPAQMQPAGLAPLAAEPPTS